MVKHLVLHHFDSYSAWAYFSLLAATIWYQVGERRGREVLIHTGRHCDPLQCVEL